MFVVSNDGYTEVISVRFTRVPLYVSNNDNV